MPLAYQSKQLDFLPDKKLVNVQ